MISFFSFFAICPNLFKKQKNLKEENECLKNELKETQIKLAK